MPHQRIESQSKPQLLRSALLDTLQRGALKVGDRLPSEAELIAKYGVSRATVREALISLQQEGWVQRLQGKGTFVSDPPNTHRTVGVVAPYLYASDSPDFRAGTDVIPILMQSIEHQARSQGVNIMLYLDNLDVDTERENILNVIERGVDALLMIYIGGGQNLDCLERIQSLGIPLILLDRYIEELPIDSVGSDNHTGSYKAVQRFLQAGFPSVVYITAPIDSTVLRDRYEGYAAAMTERGLKLDVKELVQGVGDGTDRLNYDRTCELVASIQFPTAIFSSDATRFALICEQVQKLELSRNDFALGCFDEPYLSFPDDVHFIKVLQPLREIGRMAIDLVLARLDGKPVPGTSEPPTRILLAPEILSMGPPTRQGNTVQL